MSNINIANVEAEFVTYTKKRTKDGDRILISFLVHPSDIHDHLALMPLGTSINLNMTKPYIGV
jgi:hypothetical protein